MRMRRRDGRWVAMAAGLLLLPGALREARAQEASAPQQGEGAQRGDRQGLPAGSQMVRGTVSSATSDAITLKTETGETYTVTVSPNTRVMKARQPAKLTQVKAGDGIGAVGVMDASTKTLHALFVQVVDAEEVKKAEADLGKTYIVGRVTATHDLNLTIKRPDGVLQTIAVDEGTSFRKGGRGGMGMMMATGEGGGGAQERRPGQGQAPVQGQSAGAGGESITLADVKVGDSVAGRGGLKGGVFVPTELRVMDPTQRRRRPAESANGPAAEAPQ